MKLDTEYPADSVEFCPAQGLEDILVCGTYKLIEDPHTDAGQVLVSGSEGASNAKRVGKCMLLRVQQNQKDEELDVLQEIDMPAILDMKWSPASRLLAIADSEGHISLNELDENVRLHEVQNIQCRPINTLCLSLDWSNRRNPSEVGRIAISCSDGSLSLLQPDNVGSFSEAQSWHAHDFEAWITAWDYWNTNLVYSGGDDLKLKGWDIREGTSALTFSNKKFDAGITSIHCHPHKENILAVGSYDSTVRIFDIRKPLMPLTQADVGGGAWRVKWHPNEARGTDLLVACMYDGFKIVRFSPSIITLDGTQRENGQEWDIIKRFDAHESLAYGVDWAHGADRVASDTLIASCSFYDHVLYTWTG